MNAPKGEETIFAEALRLPPEERASYLAQSTGGNAELRRRVESLLGSYGAGDFLEQAAASKLRPTLQITVRPSGIVVSWGNMNVPYVEPGTRFTAIAAGGRHP